MGIKNAGGNEPDPTGNPFPKPQPQPCDKPKSPIDEGDEEDHEEEPE